jgi:hypothetical protein
MGALQEAHLIEHHHANIEAPRDLLIRKSAYRSAFVHRFRPLTMALEMGRLDIALSLLDHTFAHV